MSETFAQVLGFITNFLTKVGEFFVATDFMPNLLKSIGDFLAGLLGGTL